MYGIIIILVKRTYALIDYESMASTALNMLSGVVNLSSENVVTIAAPIVVLEHDQSVSMAEIFSSQMDNSDFNQLSEIALAHLQLGYYRNQLLHLFVEDAMLAVCLAPEIDYGMFCL